VELQAITQEASRKQLVNGEALFVQGDSCEEMFLIKSGRIRLSEIFEDGNELTLDIRNGGDFVGANMFSGEGEYPVSAYTLEDALTCGFNRIQFEQLVLRQPKVGLQILKNLSTRITGLTSRFRSMVVTIIESRLYRVLSSVAKEHGTKSPRGVVIQFPLTHEDLGLLTGAHRLSITRAMKAR
jgi:CRP/FNR family transcriptional regulator